MNDFFNFKQMISLNIVKLVYIIGVVFITLFGIFTMFGSMWHYSPFFVGFFTFLTGGAIIVFGNLFWRVICEYWVIFFSMHEHIIKISEGMTTCGATVNTANMTENV